MKTPKGNWTRTPRLTTEKLYARAVERRDIKRAQVQMLRAAGVKNTGIELHRPPHAPTGTPARKHKPRGPNGAGALTRLSMMR